MPRTDKTTTLQHLKDMMAQFQHERGWGKHAQSLDIDIAIAFYDQVNDRDTYHRIKQNYRQAE